MFFANIFVVGEVAKRLRFPFFVVGWTFSESVFKQCAEVARMSETASFGNVADAETGGFQ